MLIGQSWQDVLIRSSIRTRARRRSDAISTSHCFAHRFLDIFPNLDMYKGARRGRMRDISVLDARRRPMNFHLVTQVNISTEIECEIESLWHRSIDRKIGWPLSMNISALTETLKFINIFGFSRVQAKIGLTCRSTISSTVKAIWRPTDKREC